MISRNNRLRKSREVQRVLQKGARARSRLLRLAYLPNRVRCPRFTVVVSVKVAKHATMRNRMKRQIRAELARFIHNHEQLSLDVVITITQTPALTDSLVRECADLLSKIRNA